MSFDLPRDSSYENPMEEESATSDMVRIVERLFYLLEEATPGFENPYTEAVDRLIANFLPDPIKTARKRMLFGHFFESDTYVDIDELENQVIEIWERRRHERLTHSEDKALAGEIHQLLKEIEPYYLKEKLDGMVKRIRFLDNKERKSFLTLEEAEERLSLFDQYINLVSHFDAMPCAFQIETGVDDI